MSTRSIVAVPFGDSWRGRYCHSDGYPTHQGAKLWHLVKERGLDVVRKVLTEEHPGWSCISPDKTETGWNDERFILVPGWGVAYTDSADDEWLTPFDTWDTEWVYILADDATHVGVCSFDDTVPPTFVGSYRWDQPEPDWIVVECGVDFERCKHYAWVHFPDLPEESQRLSTKTWLGQKPLDVRDAVGFEIKGVHYKPTGSGHRERLNGDYGERWFESCKGPSGERIELPVWEDSSGEPKLLQGVKAIYPPTKERVS
jgi:hypothetical protein